MSLLACFTEESRRAARVRALRAHRARPVDGVPDDVVARPDEVRHPGRAHGPLPARPGRGVARHHRAQRVADVQRLAADRPEPRPRGWASASNVAELDGFTLYYLCNFEGARAPKSFSMAGRSGPLHATGSARHCCRAWRRERVDEYFANAPPAVHPAHDRRPRRHGASRSTRRAAAGTRPRSRSSRSAGRASPRPSAIGPARSSPALSVERSALGARPAGAPQELALQVIEAADEISVALGYSPSHSAIDVRRAL